MGFPGSSASHGCSLLCERPGFDPWVGKIPWRKAWQSTPVFLPGESPQTEKPGKGSSPWGRRVGHNRTAEHKHMQTGAYKRSWKQNCGCAFLCQLELIFLKITLKTTSKSLSCFGLKKQEPKGLRSKTGGWNENKFGTENSLSR